DFALARYNADGTLDASFGAGGKVVTDFGGNDVANGFTFQPDGKIVVVGRTDGGLMGDFAVARYNTDGTLDTTFGTGGKVVTDSGSDVANPLDDSAENVNVNGDGSITVQGTRINAAVVAPTPNDRTTVMVQYNADGTLDATFGVNGVQVLHPVQDLEFAGSFSSALPVAGGKTLVVGSTQGMPDAPADFLVKR